MPEAVEWLPDGTPRNPRFGDIYRSSAGGLAQARHVFLRGCGLPQAWAGHAQWRVLETGFGLGLNFLATWRAWKDDPRRPRMLHFASIEAWPVAASDLLRAAQAHPELHELAAQLAARWWGLLPGFHRLAFEDGQVLLTLCIGDVKDVLRQLAFTADAVYLDGFDPRRNADMWDASVLKSAARMCRRGATLATWTVAADVRRDLAQYGFAVEKVAGLPPKRDCLRALYDPHWEPRRPVGIATMTPGRCAIIGAGLAGAATAASLARRGWQVEVFDAANSPAAGASALPAGLLAPHHSPDDNPLSRLSRAGVRITLQECDARLVAGQDWDPSGALEHRVELPNGAPHPGEHARVWTRNATADQKSLAGLGESQAAWWHEKAAWVKPAALVRAWLAQEGVAFRGGSHVDEVRGDGGKWQVRCAGAPRHGAFDLVVVAAATDSARLAGERVTLRPVRGQVSWAPHSPGEALPPFPMNGSGHLIPRVPIGSRRVWLSGSTYAQGDDRLDERQADHEANYGRLARLAPELAPALATQFARGEVQAWTGVRCASADRRPLVGEIEPGLWVSTAMGSRGLTFAALCAELLAARLHGEPPPLERRLAASLDVARTRRAR